MTKWDHNVAENILSGGLPEQPAIFFGDKVISHGQLRAAAYGWARHLVQLGLNPGDRVGLWAENGPFFVAAYLGIIRAGLCAVPFPVDCGENTLKRMCTATGIKCMLVSARFRRHVESLIQHLGIAMEDESQTAALRPDEQCEFPAVDPRRDLAAIMLTSGSTGESKGVMVTHRNIQCNTDDITRIS